MQQTRGAAGPALASTQSMHSILRAASAAEESNNRT